MSTPRVVIVSGGTFGIGRAITLRLAALGHAVTAFGLEAPQISSLAAAGIFSLAAEMKERGLKADLMEADVSNAADVARVVDATLQRHGRIDALVNNAAIGPLGTVLDTDEATFDRIMAVNLKGPYLTSRAQRPNARELYTHGGSNGGRDDHER
ncbi:MAG: SDR family NAD(P)-dependent oxidoreductase, partial [Bradyrhizobium icense]